METPCFTRSTFRAVRCSGIVPLDFKDLLYTWMAGLAVFMLGGWFFKKTQSAFADVI